MGTTQTSVWALRFLGSFVGMLAGGLLLEYVRFSEQNIFLLQGLSHAIVLLPPLYYLYDANIEEGEVKDIVVKRKMDEESMIRKSKKIDVSHDEDAAAAVESTTTTKKINISVSQQISSIWITIQDERVYSLVYFLFVVGSMPNAGSSFTNFLLGPLKFTDMEYMIVGLVGIFCSKSFSHFYEY